MIALPAEQSAPGPPAPAATASRGRRAGGVLRRLCRRPLGLISLVVLVGIVIACFAAPLTASYSPLATDFTAVLKGPSGAHLLGTDELGRDVLSRVLYGGRPTLAATAEATAIAVLVGSALGILAGYRRGWLDRILSGWTDLLLAMPVLAVLIVVISVFPTSLYPTMIPLGILLSAGPMRVVRSETLAVREELYIDAAQVVGLPRRKIMRRHVLPRVMGPIVVQCVLIAAVSLVVISGLAFLGFGVTPPAPTWGSLVADAASQYQRQPWLLVPSGGIIVLTVLALGLLGDVLTDVLNEPWAGRAGRPSRTRFSTGVAGSSAASELAGEAETEARDPDAILSVRDLTVSFGAAGHEVVVVDRVGFDLAPGRTLALVGESGCGKSMTARGILGVLPPGGRLTDGSIVLAGQELAGAPARVLRSVRGRRIGIIGQEPQASLDPSQTVGSALREVLSHYRPALSRREVGVTVLGLLEQVQLRDPARVARLHPHQLSGGMAQRVTIARALAGEPDVLIADEPTTALDVTVQAEILALLRSLQLQAGMAMLLITHDWGVVAALADEVAVMYAGQIVEHSNAEDIFARPLHPYTQALLLSDPHRSETGRDLPTIEGSVPAPGDWSAGCRFAARCRYVTAGCEQAPIALLPQPNGRLSRCIHVERLASVG
jgi:peptide/nickel transport system permease protein